LNSTRILDKGTIKQSNGAVHTYEIIHGWDLFLSQQCDAEWSTYYLRFFQDLRDNYKEPELTKILNSLQLQDKKWDWSQKSLRTYNVDEYDWFYFISDNKIQASCLTYQPQTSPISKKNVFYINFLAVAPWNRNTLITKQEFKGIGSILIKTVLEYMVKDVGLTPGLCLHSLPQATGYYQKLGMENYSQEDKPHLKYFELDEDKANVLIGA